jgi:histidyl-tRNA synthetase
MKINQQARGVRIVSGIEAKTRRNVIDTCSKWATTIGGNEIVLPCIEPTSIYTDTAGDEILGQMYAFEDKGGRSLCLRPEGTATIQLVADQLGNDRDVILWYVTRCWRYERPQAGRYREFTQFGVEWLNPSDANRAKKVLESFAMCVTSSLDVDAEWSNNVTRGLAYYTDKGFEMTVDSLGAQKQIMGGGEYEKGIGLAFGVDRLTLAVMNQQSTTPEDDD